MQTFSRADFVKGKGCAAHDSKDPHSTLLHKKGQGGSQRGGTLRLRPIALFNFIATLYAHNSWTSRPSSCIFLVISGWPFFSPIFFSTSTTLLPMLVAPHT